MEAINQIQITKANKDQRQAITALLQGEKLPVEDLPTSLDNFFVAVEDDHVIGAIGMERYDDYGLLRSMVVSQEHRNKNIASQLVQKLENEAQALGINSMYLLTETAAIYFDRKGYQKVSREHVPKSIQASSEFSSVCPASAIIMKKYLHKYE